MTNRRHKLIRRLRLALATLVFTTAAACNTAGDEFDDFVERSPEGGSVIQNRTDPAPPLTSGRYLMALATAFQPDLPVLAVADIVAEQTDDGQLVDVEFTTLGAQDKQPVGDTTIFEDIPVDEFGNFEFGVADFTIPGPANPLTGTDLVVTADFRGFVDDDARFCGDVEGSITSPLTLDLTGSTFGAILVDDGATGDALPAAENRCPE